MPDPTFSVRQTHSNWWMVRTVNGKEELFPAGTEQHAKVMVSLAETERDRAKAGLPPFKRT